MTTRASTIFVCVALSFGAVATATAQDDSSPPFELAARLLFQQADGDFPVPFFTNNHPFRSVALRIPYVYALDRNGGLYVYRVEGEDRERDVRPVKTIGNAGDGNDLKVFNDVLVCTHNGGIQVYSLEKPDDPKHIGRVGHEGKLDHSESIVRYGTVAFLLGKKVICAFDMAEPTKPTLLATKVTDCHGWTGCVVEDFLYVGEIKARPNNRQGIAVYDLSDPKDPKEVGFVATSRAPYHLFPVPGKRLLASLDVDTRIHVVTGGNIQVHGNSAIFSVSDPAQPALAREFRKSGGRSATVLCTNDQAYFVCEGVVFRIADQSLERVFSFFPGFTLDGCPYHGDSDGEYAAVVSDAVVFVLRFRKPEPTPGLTTL